MVVLKKKPSYLCHGFVTDIFFLQLSTNACSQNLRLFYMNHCHEETIEHCSAFVCTKFVKFPLFN